MDGKIDRRTVLAAVPVLLAARTGILALKSQNNILAGTSLARAQIQSPNYVPGVSGWAIFQNGNAEFNRVIIRGGTIEDGSALYYSPSPGAGNLIGSISNSSGTDTFGNAVIGGICYYRAGVPCVAVQLSEGINLYTAATQAGPYTINTTGLVMTPNGVNLSGDSILLSAGPLLSSGGTPANPSALSTDTWHAMALLNSWANAAGDVTAQYRLVASPPNSVEIIGRINATAATSTTFFTLPSSPVSYVPASVQDIAAEASGGVPAGTSCGINCDASGNLSVNHGTIGANNNYGFHGFISLDA